MHEFLVRPDEFRTFAVGEAVVWTALGPDPERLYVTPAALPVTERQPVTTDVVYRPCGPISLAHATTASELGDELDPTRPIAPADEKPAESRDDTGAELQTI